MENDLYSMAKTLHHIETILKPNEDLIKILGEEEYNKITETLKANNCDYTLDGIIDYLNGYILLLQNENAEANEEKIIKLAKQLNKIERAIDWTKGEAYPTTNNGYINNIGEIGQIYKIRGITEREKINKAFQNEIAVIFQSYLLKDYGELPKEDIEANELAIKHIYNDRILARYKTSEGDIYIITEADRSATTILFTEEY